MFYGISSSAKFFDPRGPGTDGYGYDTKQRTDTSDVAGYVEFPDLIRGANGNKASFTVPKIVVGDYRDHNSGKFRSARRSVCFRTLRKNQSPVGPQHSSDSLNTLSRSSIAAGSPG